ncbi:hypothetical protein [Synechococcus sp. PCC 7502]|nr:hypothetical protein [Synechococcus sp. PCC 7502]
MLLYAVFINVPRIVLGGCPVCPHSKRLLLLTIASSLAIYELILIT